MVDRQYQHSSHSGSRRRPEKGGPANEPVDHALGRSKGGLGTQLHLLSDGQGLVLAVGALPGQTHESTSSSVSLRACASGVAAAARASARATWAAIAPT